MSNDTISKIKLRLNNNLKIKQSKSQVVSALSNRMYANSQTSNCNDYFANCCNCCNGGCICCSCLIGFIITIEGWQDGTCDCSGLNITDVFVPKISCGEYNRLCELHGGSAPQGTYPNYTCPDPEGSNVTSFFCIEGPFAGNHPAGISWELYCIDGQLYLKVYHASNKSLKSGFIGGGETYMDGFGIWSDVFTPVDCDDLEISGILSGGGCSGQCACGNVTFTAKPVFGSAECGCCPTRCGVLDPDCLNPIPPLLSATIMDTCGTRTFSLISTNTDPNLPNLTWIGGTTLNCCVPAVGISVELFCVEDKFMIDFGIEVLGEGFEVFFSFETDVVCDPFKVIAKLLDSCATIPYVLSCNPYCVNYLIIQE